MLEKWRSIVSFDFFQKLFIVDENDITRKMKGLKNFNKPFKKLNYALFYFVIYIR